MTDIANNKVKIQNVGVKQVQYSNLLNAVIFEDDSSKRDVLSVMLDLTKILEAF